MCCTTTCHYNELKQKRRCIVSASSPPSPLVPCTLVCVRSRKYMSPRQKVMTSSPSRVYTCSTRHVSPSPVTRQCTRHSKHATARYLGLTRASAHNEAITGGAVTHCCHGVAILNLHRAKGQMSPVNTHTADGEWGVHVK